MVTFEQKGIRIPTGTIGNAKVICPSCTPHQRKPENRNAKDLSVNIAEGVWNCHNCGWKGSLKEFTHKEYNKPVKIELPMSDRAVSWFGARGIKENTIRAFKISEKSEWMPQTQKEENCLIFPYIRMSEWVNVKYRDAKKNFKLTKDAELIIFNYDGVVGSSRVVITEGEIDAMSVYESGFYHVCSVPNGAAKGNQKLDYLDNSWQAFADADEIIIATDNDEAGSALKDELIRRLGRDRCMVFDYPDGCKDLNDVLVKHGDKGIWECLNGSKRLPVEGIHRLTDFNEELERIYEYGFSKGANIGYSEFDTQLNFSPGQLTMVTGVPNSGKSAYLDQILLRLADRHSWRMGVCSFENQPIPRHIINLSNCFSGKTYFVRDGHERISHEERAKVFSFLHDHFFWFKMKDEDLSVDGILSRAKQLVKSYGINALVIDPYNYMEHKRPGGQNETEYISELLTKICNFAKDYMVHVFLVAHPTKIKKDPVTKDFEVPTLYDISGSAHFFNKADNGLTVYRNRSNNMVTVYVQKVRFFYNGKLGSSDFTYDVFTGRYTQINGGFDDKY